MDLNKLSALVNYTNVKEVRDRDHDGKFVREGYVCMANGERLEDVLGYRELMPNTDGEQFSAFIDKDSVERVK